MKTSKKIALALLPVAVGVHVYMIWLGGGWRIFALVELGVGVFLGLLLRDLKKMEGPE